MRTLMILAALSGCALHPTDRAPDAAPGLEAPEDFSFAMTGTQEVALRIDTDAGPVDGASVQIRRLRAGEPAEVLFRGLSDVHGEVHGSFQALADDAEVLVLIQHAGLEGPWDNEEARAQLGPFASSARWRARRGDLRHLDVHLVPDGETR